MGERYSRGGRLRGIRGKWRKRWVRGVVVGGGWRWVKGVMMGGGGELKRWVVGGAVEGGGEKCRVEGRANEGLLLGEEGEKTVRGRGASPATLLRTIFPIINCVCSFTVVFIVSNALLLMIC